jgi:hypothetical protein
MATVAIGHLRVDVGRRRIYHDDRGRPTGVGGLALNDPPL